MTHTKLTEDQIQQLETSFAELAPKGAALVGCFYERLLTQHPELSQMFPYQDQHLQQKQLLAALVFTVKNLRHQELLESAIEQFSNKHEELVITTEEYEFVASTLLKTLAHFAGKAWDNDVEATWKIAAQVIIAMLRENSHVTV